jgi:hypothetical protein
VLITHSDQYSNNNENSKCHKLIKKSSK